MFSPYSHIVSSHPDSTIEDATYSESSIGQSKVHIRARRVLTRSESLEGVRNPSRVRYVVGDGREGSEDERVRVDRVGSTGCLLCEL